MARRTNKFCVKLTLTPDALSRLRVSPIKTDLTFRTDRKDAPLEVVVDSDATSVTLRTSPAGQRFNRGLSYQLVLPTDTYATLTAPDFREVSAPVGRLGVIYVRNEPIPPSGGVLFGATYEGGRYKIAAARV